VRPLTQKIRISNRVLPRQYKKFGLLRKYDTFPTFTAGIFYAYLPFLFEFPEVMSSWRKTARTEVVQEPAQDVRERLSLKR
jgi:hypothetical protein